MLKLPASDPNAPPAVPHPPRNDSDLRTHQTHQGWPEKSRYDRAETQGGFLVQRRSRRQVPPRPPMRATSQWVDNRSSRQLRLTLSEAGGDAVRERRGRMRGHLRPPGPKRREIGPRRWRRCQELAPSLGLSALETSGSSPPPARPPLGWAWLHHLHRRSGSDRQPAHKPKQSSWATSWCVLLCPSSRRHGWLSGVLLQI